MNLMPATTFAVVNDEALTDKDLDRYLIFQDDVWWEYIATVQFEGSTEEFEEEENINVVTDIEDAIYKGSTDHCNISRCMGVDFKSMSFEYYLLDGEMYLNAISNYDFGQNDEEDVKVLSLNGLNIELEDSHLLSFGYDPSDWQAVENLTCEVNFNSAIDGYPSGNYYGDVFENICSYTVENIDDGTIITNVATEYYMENVGLILETITEYINGTIDSTMYFVLYDTSIDLDRLAANDDRNHDVVTTGFESTDELLEGLSEDEEEESDYEPIQKEEAFSDLNEGDKNYDAISYLTDLGVIEGYSDGTVQADSSINRAELVKVLVEGSGLTPDAEQYNNCFDDVTDQWFAKYVCYAKELEWISGDDDSNSFRPADPVNKVESTKMLLKSQNIEVEEVDVHPYSDLDLAEWCIAYIAKAKELGILEEDDSSFDPSAERTRGEVSENLFRLLTY